MKRMLFLILLISSQYAFSYTECEATPEKAWLNLSGDSVWICFEGAACVYKVKDSIVTQDHLDRMYSTALAAISRNSNLLIRYPDDNVDCSLLLAKERNDILGIWFLK